MSFEFFIARRIFADRAADGEHFSRPAVRIAMFGVAVGMMVMLISLAVVLGFKREVSSKVMGFGSHIQMVSLTQNQRYEILPVLTNDTLLHAVKSVPGIKHVQMFANKLGVLKTDDDFCGLNFKGIGEDYDTEFLKSCLVEGKMPQFSSEESSNQIVISRKVASDLGVEAGDRIFAYFMGEGEMRARRLTIAGVFETHMNDYDENYVITDIYTVRRLNNWEKDESSGLEITVHNFDKVEELTRQLQQFCRGTDRNGVTYGVFSIMLVGRGLLLGNAVGLLLCWLQQEFRLVKLDASVYYIDAVPIVFDWLFILAVNVLTVLVATLVIWGSSHLISLGKPSDTIRFE